uniref:Glycosyltransferase family 1 protein n=2 Tax=unclassified Prevotella TaxID=2638335 RepID=A0AB33IXL0_9BACT
MLKIYLDPRVEFRYFSWYYYGLINLYGSSQIYFLRECFSDLDYTVRMDYVQGMPVLVDIDGKRVKIFVDVEDRANLHQARYEWCDVYAKVNVAFGDTQHFQKLMVIGPEFGVKIYNCFETIVIAVIRYFRGRTSFRSFKDFQSDYLYTCIRRRPLQQYEIRTVPVDVKPDYIFHASTLWYNQFAATDTNKYRGDFLKACQKAGMEIEGGLFYVDGEAVLREMPDYPKYKEIYRDFICDKRLSMDDYIRKTKESVLVFNTPSVCECHGWKLAEYLCMGKAIISTPLKREMPGEGLVHGKNVHFIHNVDEIYDAVIRISRDKEYRRRLEQGARAYYEQWLAPEVVVKRMVDTALKKVKGICE